MAGSTGKEENTMPLELAIQRELEYRRIVTSFQLSPNTNFTKEVKSSNDASDPKSFPSPSSKNSLSLPGTKRKEPPTRSTHHQHLKPQQSFHGSLNNKRVWDFNLNVKSSNNASHESHSRTFPGPSLSKFSLETKAKESVSPTRSAHPNLQHQQPFHGSQNLDVKRDDLYCKICQIFCSSPFNLKQHFNGHKHNRKLQMSGNNEMQWCEVCKVMCMDENLLKLHFQGQKHRTKLQMIEISKQGEETPNKPKWFELCTLWCSDEFAFKQHLEGKKHVRKLHVSEKEKK